MATIDSIKHFSIAEILRNIGKIHMWVNSNTAAEIMAAKRETNPPRSLITRNAMNGALIGRRIGKHWFFYRPSVEAYVSLFGNPAVNGKGKGISRNSKTVKKLMNSLEEKHRDFVLYISQKADMNYTVTPIVVEPTGEVQTLSETKID